MKKLFTLLLAAAYFTVSAQVVDATDCTNLFISEYVEGFLNNKSIEIYNPTASHIDLSDYQLERYSNGESSPMSNSVISLSGIIAPYDVVVCTLDKQDPNGEGFEVAVMQDLADVTDLWLCPDYATNNAMYFNGNDAMVLRQTSTNEVLDIIGVVGEDPGSEGWASMTKDHTLVRKGFIARGDMNALDPFLVVDEWDGIAWTEENAINGGDVFEYLGWHDCICGITGNTGCTDETACNYDALADIDDGTCYTCDVPASHCGVGTFWSDSLQACQPLLNSLSVCGDGTIWDETSQTCIIDENYCSWQPDSDGDQLIGVSDLLMFLSVFGDTDLDQDGIFDSNDDCVGEYDQCGVCNGSGPSIPVIESVEILYDSVYAEPIGQWLLFEVGADTTYQFVCDPEDEESPWQCGDPLEYQGYEYATVQIGSQCWFAENLRVSTYLNNEPISSDLVGPSWGSIQTGATSIYGQGSDSCQDFSPDENACDANNSIDSLGRLYNWLAVVDERGLCPSGWHVPALSDWTSLTQYLDSEGAAGEQMKTIGGWTEGAGGTNTSGFSGLPTGYRNHDGSYQNAGNRGYWWSTTPDLNSTAALAHYLRLTDSEDVNHLQDEVSLGFAVRCIKDTE